jgi:hypothetical protein
MAQSKSLKKAVDKEVDKATERVQKGNVATATDPADTAKPANEPPAADLPTGQRSHPG